MNPLSALYSAVVRRRNQLYDRGSLEIHRLQGPVVSIGNLAVGGSGKTPFLIALGELLQQRGVKFDVLSRGYGRATRGVRLVDPEGSPRDFGDETLLIARKLRVPVIIGEDRFSAGQLAEQKFGPHLHLLDDGFQHRQLARDFDIVMVTPSDAHDTLLPTGRLREPPSALGRADAVVLTNDTTTNGLPLTKQCIWRVSRSVVAPVISERCLAFCGIARPKNFFAELSAAGIMLSGTKVFADHHRYSRSNVQRLEALRRRSAASGFVTTEKDAINLEDFADELQPLHVIPVQMQLQEPDGAVEAILESLARRVTPA